MFWLGLILGAVLGFIAGGYVVRCMIGLFEDMENHP